MNILSVGKRGTVLVCIIIAILLLGALFSPPTDFPSGSITTIKNGSTVRDVAAQLKNAGIIRSETLFLLFLIIGGAERSVIATDYYFVSPESLFIVARRIARGKSEIPTVRFTVPEGTNVFELSVLCERASFFCSKESFLALAREKEGYLFPDTYNFLVSTSEEQIVSTMESEFHSKIQKHAEDIESTGRTLAEIITLASLVEEEGRTSETRKVIAGILWKRLKLGMPLQVDAAFQYVNGKTTFELTRDDLAIDSPYNTYRYAGLPPTPITNPGLDAIMAALEPTETPYLFYLTDSKGEMHYAKTHDEHVRNKRMYLKY